MSGLGVTDRWHLILSITRTDQGKARMPSDIEVFEMTFIPMHTGMLHSRKTLTSLTPTLSLTCSAY